LHGTALTNIRHEKFCQAYVTGKSQGEAYELAGYKCKRRLSADTCANRLLRNVAIRKRITQLQNFAAESQEITIASLTLEAATIQRAAMREGNHSAAVAALTAKAKIAGLWVEKTENENTNLSYSISDQLPTEEQWEAERIARLPVRSD
jgi:phage terminase small subunit